MPQTQEPIVVPYAQLPADTLRAVLEAFVLREGTEYGAREFTLSEKVAHVLAQRERGEAQVIFDPESQSVDIVTVGPQSGPFTRS